MWFDLMHGNVEVAEMDIDETGTLLETSRVRSFDHMPYGTVSGTYESSVETDEEQGEITRIPSETVMTAIDKSIT